MSHKSDKKVIHSIRTQVDSYGRKKYRLQQVALSASQQQNQPSAAVIETGRNKSMLIGRQEGLNIEKYLGKIETNKKKKVTEVFYCDICSEGFKCDMAYITHINSPAHNRKIGMSMKVKNVSLETVASKISSLMQKKLGKQNGEGQEAEDQLIKRLEMKQQDNVYKRDGRKQRDVKDEEKEQKDQGQDEQQVKEEAQNEGVKQEDKQNADNNQEEEQQDQNDLAELQMMKHMGLPTAFGSKKHKR